MTEFLEGVRARLPNYPPYYAAPEGDLLRLDQNTNRWGTHPAVLRTRPDLDAANLYPHRDNRLLVEAFAAAHGLDAAQLVAGNGSDEILDTLLRVLVEPGGRVATPHPSYSMYPHLCRLNRLHHVKVPYDARFRIDGKALTSVDADLLLLANPDNPSGTLLPAGAVRQIVAAFPGPVVLDEAYAEYAQASLLAEAGRPPNLIVARTLSKAYGMAGLRVGFAAAHPDVAELLRRAKLPFSVNLASEQLAIAALAEPAAARDAARAVVAERGRVADTLTRLGFHVVPSHTNFLLTRPPMPPAALRQSLRDHGILARTFEHEAVLADRIRFTVGRPEENDRLLTALGEILAQETAA